MLIDPWVPRRKAGRRRETPRAEEAISAHAHPLTPAEIQMRRLELARDMVHLVLRDKPPLPTTVQHALEAVAETLWALHGAAKERRRSGGGMA
jgi:hypothetical protein